MTPAAAPPAAQTVMDLQAIGILASWALVFSSLAVVGGTELTSEEQPFLWPQLHQPHLAFLNRFSKVFGMLRTLAFM